MQNCSVKSKQLVADIYVLQVNSSVSNYETIAEHGVCSNHNKGTQPWKWKQVVIKATNLQLQPWSKQAQFKCNTIEQKGSFEKTSPLPKKKRTTRGLQYVVGLARLHVNYVFLNCMVNTCSHLNFNLVLNLDFSPICTAVVSRYLQEGSNDCLIDAFDTACMSQLYVE